MNADDDDVVVLVNGLLLATVITVDTFGVVFFMVVVVTGPDTIAVETGWIVQPIPDAPIQWKIKTLLKKFNTNSY